MPKNLNHYQTSPFSLSFKTTMLHLCTQSHEEIRLVYTTVVSVHDIHIYIESFTPGFSLLHWGVQRDSRVDTLSTRPCHNIYTEQGIMRRVFNASLAHIHHLLSKCNEKGRDGVYKVVSQDLHIVNIGRIVQHIVCIIQNSQTPVNLT